MVELPQRAREGGEVGIGRLARGVGRAERGLGRLVRGLGRAARADRRADFGVDSVELARKIATRERTTLRLVLVLCRHSRIPSDPPVRTPPLL